MKKQQLREKTQTDIKRSKQATFSDLRRWEAKALVSEVKKSIAIAQLGHTIVENELELQITFRLLPSKSHFSTIALELYFDNEKLNSYLISTPSSQLLGDDLNFPLTLDMSGICPGSHTIKVEMYEPAGEGKKLTSSSKYVVVEYEPTKKEDRYIKVPVVRKIAGTLRIVLPEEQDMYREMERRQREELASKKDQW